MRIQKELREYVRYNTDALLKSSMDFEAIYKIMFRDNGLVMAETTEGYRIRRYTYSEIKRAADRAASILYDLIGASRGFVALECENCVEWIVMFWAVLKSGNKPYLVNCRHPLELSEGIIKTLGITTVIGMDKTELPGNFTDFRPIAAKAFGEEEIKPCPEGIFENEFALSTSATSLHQSICFYTGLEISRQILDAETIIEESPRMASMYHGAIKQLAFLPFYHIFGLFAVYFWFAFFGRTFVFLKNYAPDTIARTIRRHEVTHIFAVPLLWHTVEDKIMREVGLMPENKQKAFRTGLKICTFIQDISPYWGADIAKRIMGEVTEQVFGPSVRFCISGGSYLKDSALKLFNGIGYPLHNGYGMSEVGITSVELRKKARHRNLNSAGHSLDSIEYMISDQGTLLIKGTSISSKIMIDGIVQERGEWFDTKDLATLDPDGYCHIIGRQKDTIIGDDGENINPDSVEQMIKLDDVLNFSCYGEKLTGGDEVLALVAQISPSLGAESTSAIYEKVKAINEKMPSGFKIKRAYFTTDAIMSPTAIKVSRQYLIRGISDGSIKITPMKDFVPSAGKTGVEVDPVILDNVITCISEVLEMPKDKIEPDSNIALDLGASSLQYFAVVSRLGAEYGVETYKCTTPKEFAIYIKEQG